MKRPLIERFKEFDTDNPHIYELFKKFTFEAMASGYKNFASAAIFERIRWETMLSTTDTEFKLCNDYKPCYARKFMFDFPEHDGFYITKQCSADEMTPPVALIFD